MIDIYIHIYPSIYGIKNNEAPQGTITIELSKGKLLDHIQYDMKFQENS